MATPVSLRCTLCTTVRGSYGIHIPKRSRVFYQEFAAATVVRMKTKRAPRSLFDALNPFSPVIKEDRCVLMMPTKCQSDNRRHFSLFGYRFLTVHTRARFRETFCFVKPNATVRSEGSAQSHRHGRGVRLGTHASTHPILPTPNVSHAKRGICTRSPLNPRASCSRRETPQGGASCSRCKCQELRSWV